jgi:hypothetical protein
MYDVPHPTVLPIVTRFLIPSEQMEKFEKYDVAAGTETFFDIESQGKAQVL